MKLNFTINKVFKFCYIIDKKYVFDFFISIICLTLKNLVNKVHLIQYKVTEQSNDQTVFEGPSIIGYMDENSITKVAQLLRYYNY